MQELKVGDVVQLNSGSPDLKIVAIKDGEVSVEWQIVERAVFPAACLRPVG